jgi:methylated-DNA-[protein]-cysteine S-methyltransferase
MVHTLAKPHKTHLPSAATRSRLPEPETSADLYPSPWGPLQARWSQLGLWHLSWLEAASSPPELSATETLPGASPHSALLGRLLQDYFVGRPVDFRKIPVDPTGWTDFQHAVFDRCRELQWGQTASYAELAEACHRPRAPRAVGQVMARNRVLLVIPCHRVLAANGKLGGFSAADGVERKRRLLQLEHVIFADHYRSLPDSWRAANGIRSSARRFSGS